MLLSAAGVCSRRTAETYLIAGRVTVNGQTAHLGQRADPDRDEILWTAIPGAPAGGRVHPAEQAAGLCLYPLGRAGAADSGGAGSGLREPGLSRGTAGPGFRGPAAADQRRCLGQHLLHPKHEVEKTYHVSRIRTGGRRGGRLAAVTDLEGERIRPARVEVLRETPGTAVLAVTIHEGKNRQVRRMCAQCGLTVKRLRRSGRELWSWAICRRESGGI